MTWSNDSIRELERDSIKRFVASHHFRGRVLDYGCGRQPYRRFVEATAQVYVAFDRDDYPGTLGVDLRVCNDRPLDRAWQWDEILCTQVVQYVDDVERLLGQLFGSLKRGGLLVMTYPTCWDEVEPADLWRFTRAGMENLLGLIGFDVVRHELRAAVELGGFSFPLGYGVVARA